jgi:hypothetical protein
MKLTKKGETMVSIYRELTLQEAQKIRKEANSQKGVLAIITRDTDSGKWEVIISEPDGYTK